jgi:hypothetical protein
MLGPAHMWTQSWVEDMDMSIESAPGGKRKGSRAVRLCFSICYLGYSPGHSLCFARLARYEAMYGAITWHYRRCSGHCNAKSLIRFIWLMTQGMNEHLRLYTLIKQTQRLSSDMESKHLPALSCHESACSVGPIGVADECGEYLISIGSSYFSNIVPARKTKALPVNTKCHL